MKVFLRLIIGLIVLGVVGYTCYYLLTEKYKYVPPVKEENNIVTPEAKSGEKLNKTSKKESKKEEFDLSKIDAEDIMSFSGEERVELSLTKIRKDNIDNTISQNHGANVYRSYENVLIPYEIYGNILLANASNYSGESIEINSTVDGILGNVQLSGTMIYIMPKDESQDKLEFHFQENGKLIAYVRRIASDNTTCIIYFDENEIPFEHYFSTNDKEDIYVEEYQDVFNRAKKAYDKYINF